MSNHNNPYGYPPPGYSKQQQHQQQQHQQQQAPQYYGAPPEPIQRSANLNMPTAAQLGGSGEQPWIRLPFFPTAPYYSTDPYVGYQVRYYSAGISSADADYSVNSETIRQIQFDIPCRLIAFTGAAVNTAALGSAVGALSEFNMNLTYLFRMEYTQGDKLHVTSRLASTVVGTMQNPGEIGAHGFTIDQGASVSLGITPLLSNLRIDITLICLEMRGPRNFSAPGMR